MIKHYSVKVNGVSYDVEVEETNGNAVPKFGRALPVGGGNSSNANEENKSSDEK